MSCNGKLEVRAANGLHLLDLYRLCLPTDLSADVAAKRERIEVAEEGTRSTLSRIDEFMNVPSLYFLYLTRVSQRT